MASDDICCDNGGDIMVTMIVAVVALTNTLKTFKLTTSISIVVTLAVTMMTLSVNGVI